MISVIIPLYNKEACIERTIRSVLDQSYTDFELLIIDDGSTDNSKNVVLQIKDSRIHYIYKDNGGVSSARNLGAREASSEWIFFLDADDILYQNAIESLSQCQKAHPSIKVVTGGFSIKTESCVYHKIPTCEGIVRNPLRKWSFRSIMPRTGNLLITKDAFFALGGFDERLSYNEDYGFLLKMLMVYEVAVTKTLTMVYTDDNKTLSVRKTPLSVEFGGHLKSLSVENKYVNYLIYLQYRYTLERRLMMKDANGILLVKKEMRNRFTIIDVIRNNLFRKVVGLCCKLRKP